MKKSIIALGAAGALSATIVVAPANAETPALDSLSAETDGSSSSGDLSPGAIAGIVIGVIAAVSAGGAFAVQQGLVQLPTEVASALRGWGVPVGKGPGGGGVPSQSNAKGVCSPAAFDAVIPGWPAGFGTEVRYCDGRWAQAGAKGTDWVEHFKFEGGRWNRIPTAGTKQTGMTRGCFNGVTLRQQGAPEAFIRKMPICTPAEIGR